MEPNHFPIFDTHSHYTSSAFDADRTTVLQALPAKGIVGVCEQSTGMADAVETLTLAHQFPWMYAAIGIHPESLTPAEKCGEWGASPTITKYGGDWQAELNDLCKLMGDDPKVVAIGECGLDYHWPVPKEAQNAMFEAHIKLALDLDKPIIVHDREAHADVYALLKKYKPKGIVHCYSGSAEDALWLAEQGMYLGFGGACTFKGAKRSCKAIQALPLERIVLETDCPYMTPVPHRGKRNDSSLLTHVGEHIAQLKGMDAATVFQVTTANANEVFRIQTNTI